MVAAGLVVALIAVAGLALPAASDAKGNATAEPEAAVVGTQSGSASSVDTAAVQRSRFAVTIRSPSGPPRIDTGLTDLDGNSVSVACSTCHATREPNVNNKSASDLDDFHDELKVSHGTVSCLSCHNADDYDALKLADATRVDFTDVMTLCAQCHGRQMDAYEHGAHGGMTGHWDLTRGPRQRNNCIDCHHPHAPQFPRMLPTFKPRDRFLQSRADH